MPFKHPLPVGLLLPLLLLETALFSWLGVQITSPVLLPLLNTLSALAVLWYYTGYGKPAKALACLLPWAFFLGACMTLWTVMYPELAAEAVWHGTAYRDEMFLWIKTGFGKEGSIALFLPEHALHFVVFILLALATAGAAGLFFGVLLLDYMAFFVGEAVLQSQDGLLMALMAWVPWSLFRIAGYIVLGVMAAMPLTQLFRHHVLKKKCLPFPTWKRYALSGLSLVVLDVLLKWFLAPHWQRGLELLFLI